MKYCPGLEPDLPDYNYVEYKPRPSTRKFTISKYSTCSTKPGGEDKNNDDTGGEDEANQSGRRGEEVCTGSLYSFQKTEVSSLISEWENRARGGEE